MIKITRTLRIGIIVAAVLLIIGIGSAILINQTISVKNLDEVNKAITSMVEDAAKDQSLMNQDKLMYWNK